MIKERVDTSRPKQNPTNKEIKKIEAWFSKEYLVSKAKIDRYKYLGLKPEITRFELEKKAYEKEQRYRELNNLEPLPALKKIKLL